MPGNPLTAGQLLYSSDYSNDKIVYLVQGSVTVAGFDSSDVYTPHGLPFTPLLVGTWSNDSQFSTSYDAGILFFADPSTSYCVIQSNATNYRILIQNNISTPQTFYWRAYGYMPPDVSVDTAFTAGLADKFVFNTDFNYPKIYLQGQVDLTAGDVVINHNLTYKPQVELWSQIYAIAGQYEREYIGIGDPTDTFINRVYVTNNQLVFNKGNLPGYPIKYYYKIYLDS